MRQGKLKNEFCRGALNVAPSRRTAKGSSCHRCPAFASFPPTGPALTPAHMHARARDPGLPFRLSPANSLNEPCFGNKKPSGASGSGGFAEFANCRFRLCEIAPMSRACVVDRLKASRQSDEFFVPVLHHTTHVRPRTPCSRSAREIRLVILKVNMIIAAKPQQIEPKTGLNETAWQGCSLDSSMDHNT